MDSFRSPLQLKPQKSVRRTATKDIGQNQKTLISQIISKQINSKSRLSQPPKPMITSRNQERNEDMAKTFSVNTNQLTQVSSQASLHSSHPISKSKGDIDDRFLPNQQSFDNRMKVSSRQQRKSPDPATKRNEIKKQQEQQQIFLTTSTNASHQKTIQSQSSRTKRSQEKVPKTNRPQNAYKEILNYQPVVNINQSLTAIQIKSRQPLIQNKTLLSQAIKHPSTNYLGSYQIQDSQKKLNSHQKVPKFIQKDKTKKACSIQNEPLVQSLSSPRAFQSTTMGTSLFSATESIVSSQAQYNSIERKMCLSEKIPPKGKKKRPNAQKQPKQILITREQINLQNLQSIQGGSSQQSSSQQMHNPHQTPSKYEPSFINQSLASTFKNNITQDELIQLQQPIMVGQNLNNEFEEINAQIHMDYVDQSSIGNNSSQLQHRRERSSSHLFSFQLYNANNGIASRVEESKEMTGYFGGVVLDNADYRPSSCEGTAEKKKHNEIPTPVFQTSNRSQCSFRPSDVMQLDVIRLTDEDQKEDDIRFVESKKKDMSTKIFFKEKEEEHTSKILEHKRDNFFQEESYQSKNLKKVKSTEGLGLRFEIESATSSQGQMNKQQNTQSSGNLFSKLKSFIFQSKPDIRQDTSIERPPIFYRCNCETSDKPYACKRAAKWLTYAHTQEFEYEKNKQLYENLLRQGAPSGSETQIERDITRTFTNADPCMNNIEVQQILSRVLTAFSKYDTSIGYVQGMNFIVGGILMHCSEEIAFWLFVSLIEDYEMRDIFQPKLPGLYKHSQVLQLLEMEHLENLYNHFCKHNIQVEMYASDWIFALFSNIIPISEYHFFLDQFFEGGWSFYYKFSLSFLKSLSDDLCDCGDISEILTIIKLKHTKQERTSTVSNQYKSRQENSAHSRMDDGKSDTLSQQRSPGRSNATIIQSKMKNFFNKFVYGTEFKIDSQSYKDDAVWEQLVLLSIEEWEDEFNEQYVVGLLSNFDPEKMIFKQSFTNTPRKSSPLPKNVYSQRKNSSQPLNNQSNRQDEKMEKYLHEHTKGSVQPRYKQHIPIDNLPLQFHSRQQDQRSVNASKRSQLQ